MQPLCCITERVSMRNVEGSCMVRDAFEGSIVACCAEGKCLI